MRYIMNICFDDTTELRQEIIDICLKLNKLGLCIATWGNISVRLRNCMLITPSRMDYAAMRPEDMVAVALDDGRKLSGDRLPSSETALHRALLNYRPDIAVLVHSHAPYASALACAHRALPVFVEDMAQIIGATVNCTAYVPGGRHQDLAEAACKVIGQTAMAVLLANHGVVVGGSSLQEALTATLVLEKAAMIQINAGSDINPIPEDQVTEERYRYLYKYGKE